MNSKLPVAIKETDLELVVSEKTLGNLTTNAKQIREIVKAGLVNYDIANYNEDNIGDAKKDKAMLNNAAKTLNAKRLEIEREFMQPFSEFKEVIADTVKLIAECSGKIDSVVKQSEQIYKDNKLASIENYFQEKNINLIDLKKVFKESWLNKTATMKSVYSEISEILSRIDADMRTIESMPEDVDALKVFYLDRLDLNAAIQYGNRLRENRERAQKEAERIKRQAEENAKPVETPIVQKNTSATPVQPELLTRAFRVTTTRENIIALGDFMNQRGIDFEKIAIG